MLVCLLLALLTAAVYWPVARQGFINFGRPGLRHATHASRPG